MFKNGLPIGKSKAPQFIPGVEAKGCDAVMRKNCDLA